MANGVTNAAMVSAVQNMATGSGSAKEQASPAHLLQVVQPVHMLEGGQVYADTGGVQGGSPTPQLQEALHLLSLQPNCCQMITQLHLQT